jgi:predicted dehydrogenase
MKALVIGYGSIGKRHAGNLARLGYEVVLLRHARGAGPANGLREYYDLDEAIDTERPEVAVVASPTPRHALDAARLIERGVPFLLEKPPAPDLASAIALQRVLEAKNFDRYDIAFNMRFFPPLRFVRDHLPSLGKIYSMQVAAGSYLPSWRPGTDYRKTTSASPELGGGVHIELVHELDYILWFLGRPSRVAAHVTRVGGLEISTSDICAALLVYADGSSVELHLDYLSHKNLRGCRIIAERGTLEWSYAGRRVEVFEPGRSEPRELMSVAADYDFNQTYIDELTNFIGVSKGACQRSVDISHGVGVMRTLDAIIRSSASGEWVQL